MLILFLSALALAEEPEKPVPPEYRCFAQPEEFDSWAAGPQPVPEPLQDLVSSWHINYGSGGGIIASAVAVSGLEKVPDATVSVVWDVGGIQAPVIVPRDRAKPIIAYCPKPGVGWRNSLPEVLKYLGHYRIAVRRDYMITPGIPSDVRLWLAPHGTVNLQDKWGLFVFGKLG